MKIIFSKKFVKAFKKRVEKDSKLLKQFNGRLRDFETKNHDLLRIHELTGRMNGYFAFSVTGDIRVIFQKISEEEIILVDIGSHNQVY